MRFSIDIGGTFTDLVIEEINGRLHLYKSPTVPQDPITGILEVFQIAADEMGMTLSELLSQGELFIHATTLGINAVLTQSTARTAFMTTKGHPDVLLLREGGRELFNLIEPYPDPYIPRSLTFEVQERVGSQGEVVVPLNEEATIKTIKTMAQRSVEAVAVCFLWSIVNPVHELRVGELLHTYLPGIPFTLSHKLNTSLREYRRASSTAIDASLKPIMTKYLQDLRKRLQDAGFSGKFLVVTSNGGVMDLKTMTEAPIHSIKSGPAMAPFAGRFYGRKDANADVCIVSDTGGTSFDVSLVYHDRIPWTRETWLGPRFTGHNTGFPSIDVQSIGTGGGSIAWIDEGGLLHVGPQSAGAVPGPVCYGRGGTQPTVTDASLILGYLDPSFFLGGTMQLDLDSTVKAIDVHIGQNLGIGVYDAALAVMQVATEQMVQMIEAISLNQGVDPREAVLIGGGGAAGLNAVAIARRLGCPKVIIPELGAALSAFGALLADMTTDYTHAYKTTSTRFDYERVNCILTELLRQGEEFKAGPGTDAIDARVELSAEARYPSEIWELEVPLSTEYFSSPEDVETFCKRFHQTHKEMFSTNDPDSPVDVLIWRARILCRLRKQEPGQLIEKRQKDMKRRKRKAYFSDIGIIETPIYFFDILEPQIIHKGPAIVESPFTTVVIEPGASFHCTVNGSLAVKIHRDDGMVSLSPEIRSQ